MPTPPDPKKRMTITPPAGAVLWCCWRVISKNRAAGESGRREKCTTEPGPEDQGQVRDAWPVSEWSTAKVLAQWGPGRYRVEWYDAKSDRMKEFGALFDVAEAPSRNRGPKLRPSARAPLDASDPTPMQQAAAQLASSSGGIGIVELLTLLKSEREDAREREQQASERQMQFMIQQQQQSTALLTALLQGKGTSAGDLELMRRELAQTMREEMFRLRQQVMAQQPEEMAPDETDPEAPPQDFGEAGERVAMSFMKQLEGMAPEALPKVIDFINRKIAGGAVPPNGRAHGS